MSLPDARIVILNYNGRELLPRCLPSILQAARQSSAKVKVTVLDNQSRDGSEGIMKDYPDAEFVLAPENLVLCSYNGYLKAIPEPVAILLNNDIRVDEDFIDPLLKHFADEKMFLAAPKVLSFDGSFLEAAATRAGFRWGMFWASARYPGHEREADIPSDTFSSGFGAFNTKAFLELGGYDERYFPGIMEDCDLCLRARRAGYKLVYEPASRVYHVGQASFHKKYGAKKTSEIAHRNTFLFIWKNYRGARYLAAHVFWLPARLLWAALRGNTPFLRGFWLALKTGRFS